MMIEFFDPDGANGYLANFSVAPFYLDGREWPTVEHYYQSQKFRCHPELAKRVASSPTAATAKATAKKFREFADPKWASIREEIMYRAIEAKFRQNKFLAEQLIGTGRIDLIEAAKDDLYWGAGESGNGSNRMGTLLMRLRDELRDAR